MSAMVSIDRHWLKGNALPVREAGTDKNSRGRVLIVGGSSLVPGALRLPAEAALRAGAGKVRVATIAPVAAALGVTLPEAAVIALPIDGDGEIAFDAARLLIDDIKRCDTLVVGPGMSDSAQLPKLVQALLESPRTDLTIVLDAAAVSCASDLASTIAQHQGRVLLTPHHGEMAQLRNCSINSVAAAPRRFAEEIAAEFNAVVVLKSHETIIAAPSVTSLRYASDCVGLATGGSGDVLAGAIGGLLSRGADPMIAAGWGVWLHGEAGQCLAQKIGPIGLLARELAAEFPD